MKKITKLTIILTNYPCFFHRKQQKITKIHKNYGKNKKICPKSNQIVVFFDKKMIVHENIHTKLNDYQYVQYF